VVTRRGRGGDLIKSTRDKFERRILTTEDVRISVPSLQRDRPLLPLQIRSEIREIGAGSGRETSDKSYFDLILMLSFRRIDQIGWRKRRLRGDFRTSSAHVSGVITA